MPGIKFSGPLSLRLSGFFALNKIAVSTYARRLRGKKVIQSWDANLEIGVKFWVHQFTKAMQAQDMIRGRLILDSVQTETPDIYAVDCKHQLNPKGDWYIPHHRTSDATVLYLHGGGYTFHGAMSKRFAAMLAHHIGAPVFAPDYRLTPEHPHPAQAEDAMEAWRYVTSRSAPEKTVVIGDSAGGHMMLMLLLAINDAGLAQPALGIGLCPWTDIGDRGNSMTGNDPSDLVQGWMAIKFGEWLDPMGRFGRKALSPISYDFSGLAPLYLQAGGREVLRDMILDFASIQAANGADIMLDLWPDMPHDFQLMDSTRADSTAALKRITQMVKAHVDGTEEVTKGTMTRDLERAAQVP